MYVHTQGGNMKNSTLLIRLVTLAFLTLVGLIMCRAGESHAKDQASFASPDAKNARMVATQASQNMKVEQGSQEGQNLAGAIASFTKAANQAPDSADAHFALGEALARAEHFQEALVRYTLAVTLDPNHAKALYGRSQLCRRMALHAQAYKDLSQLINLRPGVADYHYQRGTVLLKLKNITEAYRDFQRAYELDKKYPKPTLLWDKEKETVATKRV
ncbi:MAG: tetratricopeptide repeat protein [Proteobacteria bacterium]|nr:tetratricopeptide repeat protein [Pseudomonadota bacterium]